MSGEYAEYAEGTLETELAAVEELNSSGGIYVDALDKKLMVRFLLEDSHSTREGAKAAAEKLINEENVDLIVVSDTGITVNTVSDICEKSKVPCFCINAEMDSWLAQGTHKYSFNISYDQAGQLEALGKVVADKGVSVLGLISDESEEGKLFAEKAQKYFTEKKIKVLNLKNDENLVKTLKSEKADGILCYMDTDDYISLKAEINRAEIGLKASMLVNEHWPYGTLCTNSQSASFDDTYIPVVWSTAYEYESSLTKENGEKLGDWWKSEYTSMCPESVGYRHGAIEVVVDILRRAMAIDPDSIVTAAHDISLNTVLGKISFNKDNSAILPCIAAQWHYEGSTAMGESKWTESVDFKSILKEEEEIESEEETTSKDKKDSDSADK